MSSLIQRFAERAGSIREKNKNGYYKAPPLTDILVKYVFELRRTCTNYTGGKKIYQQTVTLMALPIRKELFRGFPNPLSLFLLESIRVLKSLIRFQNLTR